MAVFKINKVVATLPGVLTPNTVYAVRAGVGFDLYISDSTGSVAHKINTGANLYSGGNLIQNGFGEAGNNTNFSQWTFDTSYPAEGIAASFAAPTTGALIRIPIGDAPIALDATQLLRISCTILAGEPDGSNVAPGQTTYAYIECLDAAGLAIPDSASEMFAGSAVTTLATELKNGDTVINLTDATGWATDAAPWYSRRVAWWPWNAAKGRYAYLDSAGNEYAPGSLTRQVSTSGGGAYRPAWSRSGNTLTLDAVAYPSGWNQGLLQAGTPIRNAYGGGALIYFIASQYQAGVHRISKTFSVRRDIGADLNLYRGTRSIKLMTYFNYPGSAVINKVRLANPFLKYI